MRNLGPASQAMLADIGINSLTELADAGAVPAYRMVKRLHNTASLNLLYAMQAAIMDIDWRALPDVIKHELRDAVRH